LFAYRGVLLADFGLEFGVVVDCVVEKDKAIERNRGLGCFQGVLHCHNHTGGPALDFQVVLIIGFGRFLDFDVVHGLILVKVLGLPPAGIEPATDGLENHCSIH
jgi:hypothetical protein